MVKTQTNINIFETPQFHTNHVEEKLVSGEAPPQVTPEFCG